MYLGIAVRKSWATFAKPAPAPAPQVITRTVYVQQPVPAPAPVTQPFVREIQSSSGPTVARPVFDPSAFMPAVNVTVQAPESALQEPVAPDDKKGVGLDWKTVALIAAVAVLAVVAMTRKRK